jgi:hypothetical protein
MPTKIINNSNVYQELSLKMQSVLSEVQDSHYSIQEKAEMEKRLGKLADSILAVLKYHQTA